MARALYATMAGAYLINDIGGVSYTGANGKYSGWDQPQVELSQKAFLMIARASVQFQLEIAAS
jgi:hypothetical protein